MKELNNDLKDFKHGKDEHTDNKAWRPDDSEGEAWKVRDQDD